VSTTETPKRLGVNVVVVVVVFLHLLYVDGDIMKVG
jgi:hypothetical protein